MFEAELGSMYLHVSKIEDDNQVDSHTKLGLELPQHRNRDRGETDVGDDVAGCRDSVVRKGQDQRQDWVRLPVFNDANVFRVSTG